MDSSDTMVERLEDDPFDAAFLAMPVDAPAGGQLERAVERLVTTFGQHAERFAARTFETFDASLAHMAAHRRARPLLLLGALASSHAVVAALVLGVGLGAWLVAGDPTTKSFPKPARVEVLVYAAPRTTDSVLTDTAVTDAAVTDTAVTDATVTDTAVTDTAVTDTAVTDTAVTDTAVTNTAVTDTGSTNASAALGEAAPSNAAVADATPGATAVPAVDGPEQATTSATRTRPARRARARRRGRRTEARRVGARARPTRARATRRSRRSALPRRVSDRR
jgi:hypothetical protein